MANKRHKPDEIVTKLRQVEVLRGHATAHSRESPTDGCRPCGSSLTGREISARTRSHLLGAQLRDYRSCSLAGRNRLALRCLAGKCLARAH